MHNGQVTESLPYLEKAYSIKPDHLDCVINLSGAYILSKKFRKAVSLLEPISTKGAGNPMVWINLGAAYLGNPVLAGDREQKLAISTFEKALEIDPAAPSVAYNIGLIYRDRKDNDLANYWFNEAVKQNPMDKDARRILKRINTENQDPKSKME